MDSTIEKTICKIVVGHSVDGTYKNIGTGCITQSRSKRIKSKSCGVRLFLSIKLGKAIQEELSTSYTSKLASKCLYFGVE